MVNPTLLRRVGLRTRGVVEAALRFPGHPPGSRRDDDSSVVSRIEKHRAALFRVFPGPPQDLRALGGDALRANRHHHDAIPIPIHLLSIREILLSRYRRNLRIFPWSSTGLKGGFEPQAGGDAPRPFLRAKGSTAVDALAHPGQRSRIVVAVDRRNPAARTIHRTLDQERRTNLRPPGRQARPPPILRAAYEFRATRVPLDIRKHRQQVLVLLNREDLEAPLPDMARRPSTTKVPANVRGHHPLHPTTKTAVRSSPHN